MCIAVLFVLTRAGHPESFWLCLLTQKLSLCNPTGLAKCGCEHNTSKVRREWAHVYIAGHDGFLAFAFHIRLSAWVFYLSGCKCTPPATACLHPGLSDVPDLFKLGHA